MAMTVHRVLNANLYYWVLSGLAHGIPGEYDSQDWSNVSILQKYPLKSTILNPPCVSVVQDDYVFDPQHLGSCIDVTRTHRGTVVVFADRLSQRDSLADYIQGLFEEREKELLDYNDGFPPAGGQTVLGRLYFKFRETLPITVDNPEIEPYRSDVKFLVELDYTIS